MVVLNNFLAANSKLLLLEDLCNLAVRACAKLEGSASKTVGGVGFLMVFKKSTIAKFHLTVASLMVQTSTLANMLGKDL